MRQETELRASETRTLLLAALGGALEFYDFVIFVFFTRQLGKVFFPPDMPAWLAQLQVYGIFAAGYVVRPIGGVVIAHFGDRLGRKRMFALSVFLMAVPTLAIGLLPGHASAGLAAPVLLLLLRIVQGFAIGGEIPGAWVFVAEHARPSRVGFACAVLTSGLTVGILLGSLLAAQLNGHLSPAEMVAYGWRIPFLVGGGFGLVAVWLRRWLSETPVFAEMRANKELARELPLKSVLRGHRTAVVLSMLATWTITAGIVVVILMTPTLVQDRFHVPAARAFLGNTLAATTLSIGCVLFGLASDRIGRGRALLVGAVMLVASTYALYADLRAGAGSFLVLYPIAGFCVGVTGVVPAIMVGLFPPAVRFSGISFAYNLSYAFFGAITAPLIGYLAPRVGPLAPAHYVAAAALASAGVALHQLRAKPAT